MSKKRFIIGKFVVPEWTKNVPTKEFSTQWHSFLGLISEKRLDKLFKYIALQNGK